MKKILMVCLGNICRSPIAEATLRAKAQISGIDLFVDSAGIASYHVGEPPDDRTIKNAKKFGVDVSMLRARQFRIEDFKNFDLIFAMDKSNFNNIRKLAGNNSEYLDKVKLYAEYTHINVAEVPDPYYGSEKDFDLVFQLCEKAAESFISMLKSKN